MNDIIRPSGTIPKNSFGKLVLSQQLAPIQDAVNAQSRQFPAGSNVPHHHPFGRLLVVAQITNAADGGGIYAARRCVVKDDPTFDPAENASMADLFDDSGDDDLLLINPGESGLPTHVLATGDYVFCYLTGMAYGDLDLGIIEPGAYGSQLSPTTIGSTSEGSETADSSTWSRETNGSPVDVYMQTRTVYNHAGDKKLYSYVRKFSYDACGLLISIGAETRIEVDAAESC